MSEQKIEVVLEKNERLYTKNYHDFMDCELLNGEEKIIYLALKRFVNVKLDSGQAYPSIEKIQKITSWGNKKVIKYINSLVKKGIIEKEQQGLTKPNLYTIKDSQEMWKSKNLEELKNAEENIIDFSKIPTEVLEKELEKRKKRNEPETSPLPSKAKEETDSNINNANSLESNYTAVSCDCQEMCKNQRQKQEKNEIKEQYPLEMLKEHYEYEIMVFDNKNIQTDIDTAFSVLYEAMNTKKETIRIKSEDKPTQVVISKLLKLTRFGILYAIDKYKEQTNRIDYPTSYLLTLLYEAEEQQHLDVTNRVQYDMTHQNQLQEVREQNCEENQSVSRKEKLIEEYHNLSNEEKDSKRNKYIEVMFKGKFDKKGEISDLEKEWLNPTE